MAKKRCPNCGKRVAPDAPFCVYCSHRFAERPKLVLPGEEESVIAETTVTAVESELVTTEVVVDSEPSINDETIEGVQIAVGETASEDEAADDFDDADNARHKRRRRMAVIYAGIAFVVIAALIVYVLAFRPEPSAPKSSEESGVSNTAKTDATTVGTMPEKQDISWLTAYMDITWVDGNSVGKKDITGDVGYALVIHRLTEDDVTFNLYSYRGGECAFAENITAVPSGDEVTFVFSDDGHGHSGNGNLHFRENAIDVDVIVADNDPLPEETHSLAMDAELIAQALPHSEGVDVFALKTVGDLANITDVEPVVENELTTYSFDNVTVSADSNGNIRSTIVEYKDDAQRSAYCFECIDGTMTYDTVQTYFGKANQDYVESPTDIHVLGYELSSVGYLRFTFDAQSKQMIRAEIEYIDPQ